jgi:hypothetical protein
MEEAEGKGDEGSSSATSKDWGLEEGVLDQLKDFKFTTLEDESKQVTLSELCSRHGRQKTCMVWIRHFG